ncbi:hypothetical protein CNR22_19255 [Sphingobacteriaceae bacterium]|nr:hypothetical protein CNR22_19255 [Sphingobacteriaceae bacterium]
MKSKILKSLLPKAKCLSKNQFLILLAVCHVPLLFSNLNAQNRDSVFKEKYEKETVLLDLNTNCYTKNNTTKKIGFFGKKINTEFENVGPESQQEYKRFRKQTKRGKILAIAGGVAFLTVAAAAPVIAIPVFAIGFGGGVGAYSIGLTEIYRSRRHLNKAVWLRNRDVLMKG